MARLPKSSPKAAVRLTRPRLEVLEDKIAPSNYFVLNSNDAGPGSLRQAILNANAHPGADTVHFQGSGFAQINVSSEIAITDEVTILVPAGGTKPVTVSGGGATRVLSVAAGTGASLRGLTIADGKVPNTSRGGGILNNGNLTLIDSTVTGCTAGAGAGIENTGTLSLLRSSLTNNHANGSGAGLHTATGGSATLNQSNVTGNSCVGDGAGIRSERGSSLTITNSTVNNNTASGFGTGGIASGALLTIRNTLITGNTSAAAAIYLMPGTTDVVISKTTITDNGPNATSGSGVGGIWSYAFGGHIRIEDSVIANNRGSAAGGFFGFGQADFARTQISNNTGTGIRSFSGLRVVDSTVSGNTGSSVGGIYSGYYGLELTRSTVSGNTAVPTYNTGAGGVLVFGPATIQNSTISGNTVIADNMYTGTYSYYSGAAGGVLAIVPGVTIDNSTIAFNEVSNAPLAISQVSGGVTGMDFSFTGYFGGTYEFHAEVGARNTIISGNSATDRDPDVTGSFVSGGHNLIGVLTDGATGFVASDLRGTADVPLDAGLKPLADNGGYTLTHMLNSDSPARNAGDNVGAPPTDQRGFNRIVAGTIDIGAVEAPGNKGGGGPKSATNHKFVPSKKPPSWTPIQTTNQTAASQALVHIRGLPIGGQVAELGKLTLPDLGIRIGVLPIDVIQSGDLELTI